MHPPEVPSWGQALAENGGRIATIILEGLQLLLILNAQSTYLTR